MSNAIRTKAFVLRRTNYGESDRILTLLTENGQVSAIARGVRKEKSKLAGGIEMFCLSDLVLHEGKNNSLYVLTSAKMLEAYSNIMIDLEKLEIASRMLKIMARVSESSSGDAYFKILSQALAALNTKQNHAMIESWFILNFLKASGEEINVFRDINDEKLSPVKTYVWHPIEKALAEKIGGNIGPSEIKLMRLSVSSDLAIVARVKDAEQSWLSILNLAKTMIKL